MSYEMVIGLEVHVQLNTQTKIFCGCSTIFGQDPNTQTCPGCLGHPGGLPVLNQEVLKKAIMAGLAFSCTINSYNCFDRKNYFYPDLPGAYQTSQDFFPVCVHGKMEIKKSSGQVKTIRINRMHMEEDAGKLVHSDVKSIPESYIDLNRASTPLIEIVSEPDMTDAEEAILYVQQLRQVLKFINVSDANMEEGSLRCDVNISLKPKGSSKLGTRVEIKNLNSFRSIQRAIEAEFERQEELLNQGQTLIQETRLYDADENITKSMRTKENAHDYRFFPDPNIPPIILSEQEIDAIQKSMPPLPSAIEEKLVNQYKIKEEDAKILVSEKEYAGFIEEAIKNNPSLAQKMASFLLSDILGQLKDLNLTFSQIKLKPQQLAQIFVLIEKNTISLKIAKEILPTLLKEGKDPEEWVKSQGLIQISDSNELQKIIEEIVQSKPENVAQYHAGKTQVLGFFVGQVMKATQGKANPQVVNELLKSILDKLK